MFTIIQHISNLTRGRDSKIHLFLVSEINVNAAAWCGSCYRRKESHIFSISQECNNPYWTLISAATGNFRRKTEKVEVFQLTSLCLSVLKQLWTFIVNSEIFETMSTTTKIAKTNSILTAHSFRRRVLWL